MVAQQATVEQDFGAPLSDCRDMKSGSSPVGSTTTETEVLARRLFLRSLLCLGPPGGGSLLREGETLFLGEHRHARCPAFRPALLAADAAERPERLADGWIEFGSSLAWPAHGIAMVARAEAC